MCRQGIRLLPFLCLFTNLFPFLKLGYYYAWSFSTHSILRFSFAFYCFPHKKLLNLLCFLNLVLHTVNELNLLKLSLGPDGLEPSTPRLSSVCSNQLSYEPLKWWSRTGSNRWPAECKSAALPTELRPHLPGTCELPRFLFLNESCVHQKIFTKYNRTNLILILTSIYSHICPRISP